VADESDSMNVLSLPIRAAAKTAHDGPRATVDAARTFLANHLIWARNVLAYRVRAARGERSVVHDGVHLRVDHPHFDTQVRSWLVRGEYETPEARLVERHLAGRDLDVVELGGGMGYVTCCIDRLLPSDRTHVVVEADRDVRPVLAVTREANGARFVVHPAAYAPVGDLVTFYRQERFTRNSIRAERSTRDADSVPAVSLADLCEAYALDRVALVADVEGAEYDLLDHEGAVLRDHVDLLVVEFHAMGERVPEAGVERLAALGFELVDRDNDVYVFESRS
jgi:FkbM family methyltransferase